MKRVLFLAAFLWAGSTFAQGPILTAVNTAPVPGDVFAIYMVDSTGVPDAMPGADMIWDYSDIQVNSTPMTLNWVEPLSTPYVMGFPGSTVCEQTTVGTVSLYSYAKVDSMSWSIIGTASLMITYIYTDPEKVFEYPFAYQSTFTDNVSATGMMATLPYFRNGFRTVTGEGWGKLILPSGEYNNVLMVKFIQHYADSSSLANVTINNVGQAWYDGIHKAPIFQIYHATNIVGGIPVNAKYVSISQAVSGNSEIHQEDLNIAPNPAQNRVVIHIPQIATGKIHTFYITDIRGENLLSFPSAGESTTIDISGLPSGLYLIRSDLGLAGKFVKE